MTTESLDIRIADLLRPDAEQLSSSALMALIGEVDKAIEVADREGRAARARSIDPSTIDAGARGRAEDQEFMSARYRAGLAKLRELLAKATIREARAAWSAEAEPVELQVAQAADQVIEVYPRCVHELIALFQLMQKTDKAVAEINNHIPAGCKPLRGVEMVARKITEFLPNELRIAEKCQLPGLSVGHGKGSTLLVWPPPQPNFAAQYAESVSAMLRAAPPAPSEAERIAESERHIAAGMERERQKERIAAAGGR
jgi:hypothetical protein